MSSFLQKTTILLSSFAFFAFVFASTAYAGGGEGTYYSQASYYAEGAYSTAGAGGGGGGAGYPGNIRGGTGGAYGGGGGGQGSPGNSSITSTGGDGIIVVTWTTAPAAPTCSVTLNPSSIYSGANSTLTWTTTDESTMYINNVGYVSASGSTTVAPTGTTDYSGTVTGGGGTATCAASLTVSAGPSCTISFDSNPITQGGGTNINWSSTNASSLTIAQIGAVTPNITGTAWVQPTQTTDYTGTISYTSGGSTDGSQTFDYTAAGSGAETYSTPGVYTFTVPTYSSLSVSVWGAGGGGGSSGCSATPSVANTINGSPGGTGGASSFNGSIVGGGGTGGQTGGRSGNSCTNGVGGAGGTGSGGATNTGGSTGNTSSNGVTGGSGGNAPSGGAGGAGSSSSPAGSAGSVPGAGGGGGSGTASYTPGGGGGSGAYVTKSYTTGQLTAGANITVIVGSGGAGGDASLTCGGAYGSGTCYDGGVGASGQVSITW